MTAILEDAKEIVVDKWGTLNTAASPSKLPEGQSPDNLNVWMDEKPGSVVTSLGYTKLGQLPSGNPPTLLLEFYKTSDGSSQLICSDNTTVWWTTDYVTFTQIKTGLSSFFQLRGAVIRDKVWLTNGSDSVMTWNGSALATLDGTAGTPDVPPGRYIAYHDERIWMYGISGDLSSLRFSALADSTGTEITPDDADAWPADNELQISEGDADQGTGIFMYRGYLYCSKQYSVWRVVGYDEYTYTRVKTRSSTGTRFQESIQIKDNLVHFIGVDGLYVFDGEEAKRISDIVDPANPEPGVFAFSKLQQPLLTTEFWNMSETADLATGTVPANLSTANDALTLSPADDTQANFEAGTHDDTTGTTNPGNLQLDLVTSGNPGTLLSAGKYADIRGYQCAIVGSKSYVTDGNDSTIAGYRTLGAGISTDFVIDLGSVYSVGRVVVKGLAVAKYNQPENLLIDWARIEVSSDDSTYTPVATVLADNGGSGGAGYWGEFTATDFTLNFSTVTARYVRLFVLTYLRVQTTVQGIYVYQAGYEPDGKFISKTLDLSVAPASYGNLVAIMTTNSQTYQFFTQSSADGTNWDAEVNVANEGAIGSVLKRYLRWGVYLYSSNGQYSPVIDKVYVGTQYISPIKNTGGNLLQWGAYQLDGNRSGTIITSYFRAASTNGAVSAQPWTAIVPGAIPNTAITNTYIQIKIEMYLDAQNQTVPVVNAFTVNWVLSSTSGATNLQNVGSFIWGNRYWLAASTLGATENDIVLILGKSTFESPWHKKDFKLLSFCRFGESFIGGSSEDGSIYRLEYGYSKNGSTIDSYYETADFGQSGFIMKGKELMLSCERSGEYDLSVGYSTDGGLTYTDIEVDLTQESGQSDGMTKRLNINFMAPSVRFRVRTNGIDRPFSVDELRLYYRLTTSRGDIV